MARLFSILFVSALLQCVNTLVSAQEPVKMGDPFILNDRGTYYMYGTSDAQEGIKVYRSKNLNDWTGPVGATGGFALVKSDVWGEKGFWAPEVYHLDNRYYMFFCAEEHIAVATSNSPLGPFVQEVKKPLISTKAIDPHMFIDNGHKYLYYVAFTNGNVIWRCELNDDLQSVKENTVRKCFGASQKWELSRKKPVARVNEGPFMLKHNNSYYLVYSANHFANPDYSIGYATAPKPTGPWTKYKGNPIVSSTDKITGPGHCGFFRDRKGNLYIVYHSHFSAAQLSPRIVHINRCEFIPNPDGGPDLLKIRPPKIKIRHRKQ